MPIYEYRCEKGHTFEVMQRFSDDPVTTCTTCSRPVQRVFHPIAVHFKGKGFYNTDYGTRNRQRELAKAGEGSSSEGSSSSDSAAGSEGKGDKPAKPDKPDKAAKSDGSSAPAKTASKSEPKPAKPTKKPASE
ncbi:MAG TPA: zinc ribbon domain-containing protein [Solirubrobacteraceae bacterium]|jgi:putative FmdB family regulatory protein|nr:zinc ribbon domain-containing protein [Solirubrobacteraceae bacterium]